MAEGLKLSRLPLGTTGRVKDLPRTGNAFLRLREMGLLPGTSVTFVRAAPMGDPIEIRVRGYNLSLRLGEAEQITLEG